MITAPSLFVVRYSSYDYLMYCWQADEGTIFMKHPACIFCTTLFAKIRQHPELIDIYNNGGAGGVFAGQIYFDSDPIISGKKCGTRMQELVHSIIAIML